MEEEWRPIPGLEGYEASSLGRIRSPAKLRRDRRHWLRERLFRPAAVSSGYLGVKVRGGDGPATHLVHRLVALAFLGPMPLPKMDVAHHDGDKTNNRPENLRWATRSDNNRDKRRHGRVPVGSKTANARFTEADILVIRARLAEGETQSAIARDYGVNSNTINSIAHRETWRHI